jgi:hypothetical protein
VSVFEASRASGVPDFGSSLFHSSVAAGNIQEQYLDIIQGSGCIPDAARSK